MAIKTRKVGIIGAGNVGSHLGLQLAVQGLADVRSCKGRAVRTESKDLAPHHHFAFLISNFSFKRDFQGGEPPQ